MAVAHGVGLALQHDLADALGPAHAVRGVGERLRAAVLGNAALPGELDERRRRGHHRHTTGESERALPRPQRLDRPVHRDQRRRARRVDRDGRALEAEHVGHAARRDAARTALTLVSFHVAATDDGLVVVVHQAGEHAGRAAPQRRRVDARAFEGFPGGLQQQALLGVGGERLPR